MFSNLGKFIKKQIVQPIQQRVVQPIQQRVVQPVQQVIQQRVVQPVIQRISQPIQAVQPIQQQQAQIIHPVQPQPVQPQIAQPQHVQPQRVQPQKTFREAMMQQLQRRIIQPAQRQIQRFTGPTQKMVDQGIAELNYIPTSSEFRNIMLKIPRLDLLSVRDYYDVRQVLDLFRQNENLYPFVIEVEIRLDRDGQIGNYYRKLFSSLGLQSFLDGVFAVLHSDTKGGEIRKFIIRRKQFKGGQLIKHNRSDIGQGLDYEDISIYQDQYCYIPDSGFCIVKCIRYMFPEIQEETIKDALIKLGVVRDKFPRCKLRKLSNMLGKKITSYWYDKHQFRPFLEKECDMIVYNYKNHWCVIKKGTKTSEGVKSIERNLKIIPKQIKQESLELITKIKPYNNKDECKSKIYNQTFVYDIEAVRNQKDEFVPYACAFLPLKFGKGSTKLILDSMRDIKVYEGNDCILQMMDTLANYYNNYRKRQYKINMIAHNGKKFDTFIVLQQSQLKFTEIIKSTTGIVQLTCLYKDVYFKFKCSMAHLQGSLLKLCQNFKIDKRLYKKSCDHNEITIDNWQQKKDLWYDYLKYDVISLCKVWWIYTTSQYDITGLNVNKFCTAPGFSYQYFNKIRNKDVDIYKYDDLFIDKVLRKSVYGGRVMAYQKEYESKEYKDYIMKLKDEKGVTIEEQIEYQQEIQEKIQEYRQLKNQSSDIDEVKKYRKLEVEYEKKLEDSKIRFQFGDVMIAFDANSLYPSAMHKLDKIPDISTSKLVKEEIDIQNEKRQYLMMCDVWLPKKLKFIPCMNRTEDGQIIYNTGNIYGQLYCDIDIQEIIKFGGEITKQHWTVVFEKSIDNPLKDVVSKLYKLRNQYKKDKNDVMQETVKLILNSLYGKLIQKRITEKYMIQSSGQFLKQYDDNTLNFDMLENGQVIHQIKDDKNECQAPFIFGVYILAMSKQIMNQFIIKINGHKKKRVYYTDTDSMYIKKKYYNRLQEFVHGELGGGKNDYEEGAGIIKAQFYGQKQKICYVYKDGIVQKKVTFKGIMYKCMRDLNIEKLKNMDEEELFVEQDVWKRSFKEGVIYGEKNQKKKISNDIFLRDKIELDDDGEYQLIHIDENSQSKSSSGSE